MPWLGAPDWSPNGAQLVAERYLPSDDPLAAPLWGVVVYDIASRTQWDLVEGAAQPAWRPDTPADPLALRQARQGEFVVTLQPPLRLDGHEYTVSYLTTGALRQDSARLLALFTPEYLEQQQITALVVSEDGEKTVTDPELLRRIFSLYPAAYSLYNRSAFTEYPFYAEELEKVLNNPIFMALAPGEYLSLDPDEFVGSRRIQTAEALRLLLQDGQGLTMADDIAAALEGQTITSVEEAISAIDGVIEKEYAYSQAARTLSYDMAVTLQELETGFAHAESALFVVQLLARVLLAPNLAEQRAGWLADYLSANLPGAAALDRDQLRAAVEVLDVVEVTLARRV